MLLRDKNQSGNVLGNSWSCGTCKYKAYRKGTDSACENRYYGYTLSLQGKLFSLLKTWYKIIRCWSEYYECKAPIRGV